MRRFLKPGSATGRRFSESRLQIMQDQLGRRLAPCNEVHVNLVHIAMIGRQAPACGRLAIPGLRKTANQQRFPPSATPPDRYEYRSRQRRATFNRIDRMDIGLTRRPQPVPESLAETEILGKFCGDGMTSQHKNKHRTYFRRPSSLDQLHFEKPQDKHVAQPS